MQASVMSTDGHNAHQKGSGLKGCLYALQRCDSNYHISWEFGIQQRWTETWEQ